MVQLARLITPQGNAIALTPEIYQQIRSLLAAQARRPSPDRLDGIIRVTYGKYADGVSLTQALLAERADERAREDVKTNRVHE